MGVPHHLINGVHPDADFTASDFRAHATRAVDSIMERGLLPIIAGGSNSYIEELVDRANGQFRPHYKCCFIWVDMQLSVLHDFVSERVDRMIERGLVEEVRVHFDPNADYTRGLRRAIGVPELDGYLRSEGILEESERRIQLTNAIDEIKTNTSCKDGRH
ncbi:adenylate isopentenyltransferase 3, chloroplastic-like [Carex rostrata]